MLQASRPPFDPELEGVLAVVGAQVPTVTPETIPALREMPLPIPSDEVLLAAGVTRREITIPGYEGAELAATVLARADHRGTGPGVYHLHGGGMIAGERMVGVSQILPWIVEHDAVAVTIEYRLAPEFPDPYPVEDCYAGLGWTADHADELGIDRGRLRASHPVAGSPGSRIRPRSSSTTPARRHSLRVPG